MTSSTEDLEKAHRIDQRRIQRGKIERALLDQDNTHLKIVIDNSYD